MGFGNPVVGGSTLIRDAIQSPDYAEGAAGWAIRKDGTAQFSDIEIIETGGSSEITVGQVNTAILGLFPGNTATQVRGGLVAQSPQPPFSDEVWNDMTLTAGWTAITSGENPPQYRLIPLDIGGITAVRGVVQVPASGAYNGVVLATLPAGYRPSGVNIRWPVMNITGGLAVTGYCILNGSGQLQLAGLPAGFSSGQVDLTGLAWTS